MNRPQHTAATLEKKHVLTLVLGLTAVLLFFAGSGFISHLNTRNLNAIVTEVTQTHETILTLNQVLSAMKDAETGQRGYLLTGEDSYLEPYRLAVASVKTHFEKLTLQEQQSSLTIESLTELENAINVKLNELETTIDLFNKGNKAAALGVVETHNGKVAMDAIRNEIAAMQQAERDLRAIHLSSMKEAYNTALVSGLMAAVSGALLACLVALLLYKANKQRAQEQWLQNGQAGLAAAMLGDQRVDQLGQNILKYLAEYLDAQAGAFFTSHGGAYKKTSTYGVPVDASIPQQFDLDDGLLGQAVRDKRSFIVRDVPDGYLTIGSAMGQAAPRHLVIAPAIIDGQVNAVMELGFLKDIDDTALELISESAEAIGVALRAADYRAHLQDLLEETQRQAEELQTQSEELRVSNEELEEQSRALKESQARLEQQQLEMEQTNTQLEEQTQQLEMQRDELYRANQDVLRQSQKLEQASQYKSDFLANMSHELRTPLNSSLILAKLLADNPDGNLTEEQVKYAQTIQGAGNDLLTLINDILDLSKIEAGHMEIKAEPVRVARMVEDMSAPFKVMAKEKKLDLKIDIAPGTPERIEVDRLRLEQILKNLLSNALKFTEKGSVTISVSKQSGNRISFAVTDTGIGISEDKQATIFDAFQQADGTISRKYGGTGLGLSISRELARLLGGSIELESTPGQGSTFTITVPQIYDPANTIPKSQGTVASDSGAIKPPAKSRSAASLISLDRDTDIEDDRDKVTSDSRTILVVEDDDKFAKILYDLAHGLDFLCLIARSAEEGLSMARQYLPSAILLDIGLPDNSGLSVLDRLKRNPHTRHIPVHVVSAEDYTETALSLGAVGYMLKPVKHEQITEVFKQLEDRMSQKLHRILLVEDDKVQRESVMKLLGGKDTEIIAVGTAADCLAKLKETTFDCMVLDLSLPDASGYSLLETLSQEDAYSFPPVIVYTGRDLSGDEEQKLRRYSKSIIIKGAKSPERLLDEVTLFLHQVVSELPVEQQKMLQKARNRDSILEGRRILIVEDDVRNVYSLNNILEPRGAIVQIARNGKEAIKALEESKRNPATSKIDLILMDVMMPEMDGLTATREIRKEQEWKKLPIIMLTAKAMRDDQENCLNAGANDYMAKPLDVEKLLSLVRVWMPR